jgi:hypothetical protein
MSSISHDDAIARAVLGISAPFFTSGELRLGAPVRLRFTDGQTFVVAPAVDLDAQVAANAGLLARAKPAQFGDGRRTRYDPSVRDGAQIPASEFVLDVVDLEASGLLEQVRAALAPDDPAPITAEPYALHHYGRYGHFEAHKDTPTSRKMIGSLVLCLPSRFKGGALVFSHAGHIESVRWAAEIEDDPAPDVIRWAAFFGDVDHEVASVWDGSRVTITYRLLRAAPAQNATSRAALAPSEREASLVSALSTALADRTWRSTGERVAIPCVHMYSTSRELLRSLDALEDDDVAHLKGRDAVVARAALRLGLRVALRPIVYTNADEESFWELPEYPSRVRLRDRSDPDDVTDALPDGTAMNTELDFLVRPPSSSEYSVRLPSGDDAAAKKHLDAIEYSSTGYFGNEGGYGDFYMYSALVIDVPKATKRKSASKSRTPTPSGVARPANKRHNSNATSSSVVRQTKNAIDVIVARSLRKQ